jgi:hypothetical protein
LSWKGNALLLGIVVVVVFFVSRWQDAEQDRSATAFAKTVPSRLEHSAKNVMARACNMLDWIEHLQLKRGEPLPAKLILSDGHMPWESLPPVEQNFTNMESNLRGSSLDVLVARDRLSALRNASQALQASATDLLTAQIAADSGRAGTAKSKFESAREQAQRAVNRAEEAMEPLPTKPILEGGAVMLSTADPCDAL